MNKAANKSYDEMVGILSGITDPASMKKILSELLTDAERDDLVLRWRLLGQLADGVSQREIAKNLGISLCKITRGAKILKDEDSALYSIFMGDGRAAPLK